MLSYPLPEAEVLLQDKLAAAKESLENCEEDLDFLRQQITVGSPPLGWMETVSLVLSEHI